MDIYLHFADQAREAIAFYEEVFETEPAQVMTFGQMPQDEQQPLNDKFKDLVLNASLKLNDTNVMISDSPEGLAPPIVVGNNVALVFNAHTTEKATKIFRRLTERGTILLPLEKTFWAKLYGMVKDQYGVMWHINLY